MPSLWKWLCGNRQQYRADASRETKLNMEYNHESPYKKKKKLFNFISTKEKYRDEGKTSNSEVFYGRMSPQPMDWHFREAEDEDSKGIERDLEDETMDELRKMEERVEDTNGSKRRRLAYELFNDSAESWKNSKIDPSNFLSEPNLNITQESHNHGGKSKQPLQQHHQLRQQHHHYHQFDPEHDVEMRKRASSEFFPHPHRHSLFGVQRPGGPGRYMEARRSESMYGYVPRAVSLQDASALLFGQESEEKLPSFKTHHVLEKFAKSPSSEANVNASNRGVSSSEMNSFSKTTSSPEAYRGITTPVIHENINSNQRQIKPVDDNTEDLSNQMFVTDNFALTSVTNENFSFAQSRERTRNVDNANISSVQPNFELEYEENRFNPYLSSATREVSHRNMNSDMPLSSKNGTNFHNENDMPSIFAHIDNLNGNGFPMADSNDRSQFEGIFDTDGEVLY